MRSKGAGYDKITHDLFFLVIMTDKYQRAIIPTQLIVMVQDDVSE